MLNKIKSRKFFVFIVWLIFTAYLVFAKGKTDMLQYFFIISIAYIGGQGVVDIAEKLRK